MGAAESRLEDRHEVHLAVYVKARQGHATIAIMQDVSRTGGRLRSNRRFEPGSEISVRLPNATERSAVVRRCIPIEDGTKFDIGLELMAQAWPDAMMTSAVASAR